MPQSPLHRNLVSALVEHIARNHAEVSNAAGVGTLPDPPKIGRHEPDVLARGVGDKLVIGEAKIGDDIDAPTSQEQFADFTTYLDDSSGESAVMVLAVPEGWREKAEQAIREAGGNLDHATVVEVGLPGAPTPPGSQ
jgi:hypothetical protein